MSAPAPSPAAPGASVVTTPTATPASATLSEAFAGGLKGMLEPSLRSCDASIMEVLQSQEVLARQIDKLSSGTPHAGATVCRGACVPGGAYGLIENGRVAGGNACGVDADLQTFLELSSTPALTPFTKKLTNSRRRLFAVNTTLTTVLERLERLSNVYGNATTKAKLSVVVPPVNTVSQP